MGSYNRHPRLSGKYYTTVPNHTNDLFSVAVSGEKDKSERDKSQRERPELTDLCDCARVGI